MVDTDDLAALAGAAELLAATQAAPAAVAALLGELARAGVRVRVLDTGTTATARSRRSSTPPPGTWPAGRPRAT